MTDSVAVIESSRNKSSIETAIQTWLNDNSGITSVDDTEVLRRGSNKVLIIVMYSA